MKRKSLLFTIVIMICLIFTSACATTPQISADKLSLVENQTQQLTANFDVVKWETSNNAVATVKDGLVTALSARYAIITAT